MERKNLGQSSYEVLCQQANGKYGKSDGKANVNSHTTTETQVLPDGQEGFKIITARVGQQKYKIVIKPGSNNEPGELVAVKPL